MTKSNDGKNGKNGANNRNGKQDYEVGYGKPPVHGQIKPGEVRNPKGRPKGSKNMSTLFSELLKSNVQVTVDGRKRKMSYKEALVTQMGGKALTGSMNDQIKFVKSIEKFLPKESKFDEIPAQMTIRFIESDGNGRPANPDDLLPITDYTKYRITDTPSDTAGQSDAILAETNDTEIEAAWKASNIDDEPEN